MCNLTTTTYQCGHAVEEYTECSTNHARRIVCKTPCTKRCSYYTYKTTIHNSQQSNCNKRPCVLSFSPPGKVLYQGRRPLTLIPLKIPIGDHHPSIPGRTEWSREKWIAFRRCWVETQSAVRNLVNCGIVARQKEETEEERKVEEGRVGTGFLWHEERAFFTVEPRNGRLPHCICLKDDQCVIA